MMITKEYEKVDKITEISEAVRLHYLNDDKFNTNLISIVWTIPAKRETATLTALIAEALRLGENGDRALLEEKLSEMYGAVFDSFVIQKGGRQLLTLNIECVSDSAAEEKVFKNAVSLIRRTIESKITEKALMQAKSRLKNTLLEKNDSSAQYAVERLIDITYPDDAFSVHCGGYASDIDDISVRELNEMFVQLKKSSHTDIFINGEVDYDIAVEVAKSFIGRRNNVEKLPIDEIKEIGGTAEKAEKRNIGQSRIAMAYTSELKSWGKEWCIGLVLREILCGSGSSVLYDSVRQEGGLCYYIGGRLMRFRMLYVIDAGVSAGNEKKTVELIEKGIKNLCVNEDKLNYAKKAVERDFKAAEDRRSGVVNEKLNEMLLGVTINHDIHKDLEGITVKDIIEAANGLKIKGVFIIEAE